MPYIEYPRPESHESHKFVVNSFSELINPHFARKAAKKIVQEQTRHCLELKCIAFATSAAQGIFINGLSEDNQIEEVEIPSHYKSGRENVEELPLYYVDILIALAKNGRLKKIT